MVTRALLDALGSDPKSPRPRQQGRMSDSRPATMTREDPGALTDKPGFRSVSAKSEPEVRAEGNNLIAAPRQGSRPRAPTRRTVARIGRMRRDSSKFARMFRRRAPGPQSNGWRAGTRWRRPGHWRGPSSVDRSPGRPQPPRRAKVRLQRRASLQKDSRRRRKTARETSSGDYTARGPRAEPTL